MLTALVTGASGTVGSVVVRHLADQGWRVRALLRTPSALVPRAESALGDLLDAESLAPALRDASLVVHCAAALSADRELCWRTIVDGTQQLLDAAARAGCRRFIYMSSVSVYDVREGWALNEDSPRWSDLVYPYGRAKVEAEDRVLEAGEGEMESVILRPVPVLSMHPTSFWGPLALARASTSTEPLFASRTMPFVHAENLAHAVSAAATSHAAIARIYDVVDGHGETEAYLAAVACALGRSPARLLPDAPRMWVDGTRIRAELGYSPTARWDEFLACMRAPSAAAVPASGLGVHRLGAFARPR